MARPGSSDARRIANGSRATDLSAAAMSDAQAQEVQEFIELQRGTRCHGCGRRITLGFQFTSIDPRDPQKPLMELAACTRDDCGFAELAKDGATYMKMVEFVWLDENGSDAPATSKGVIGTAREPAARDEQPGR